MINRLFKVRWLLPFLVGFFLVVSKFSENANRLPWSQLGQGVLFSSIVSALGLLAFYAVPTTRKASPILASMFVIVTMMWMVFPYTLIAVGIMLVSIVVFVYLREDIYEHFTSITTIVICASLIVAFVTSGINSHQPSVQVLSDAEISLEKTPDIYFIVPDRFCSHKGLLELGYDNSAFMGYLRSNGFYVNEGAVSLDDLVQSDRDSDTTRTARFLASVLNMGDEVPLSIPYNEASHMVKWHEFGHILKANGYSYYHIGDWWAETETNPMADVNYIYRGGSFMPDEELSMALMDRSIFRYLTTYFWHDLNVNRARHMYQLEAFRDAVDKDSPKFVFVHALLPHPPFVWASDGTAQDDNSLSQIEAYIEQVRFSETFLSWFIEVAPEDSIFIIQSDEGLCFTDRQANFDLTQDEWAGVLSAWRIPDADYEELNEVETIEVLKYIVELLQQ